MQLSRSAAVPDRFAAQVVWLYPPFPAPAHSPSATAAATSLPPSPARLRGLLARLARSEALAPVELRLLAQAEADYAEQLCCIVAGRMRLSAAGRFLLTQLERLEQPRPGLCTAVE